MTVEQTLLELEEELWRANREGDGAFYNKILRDDVLLVSRFGVAPKQVIVNGIQANHNPFLRTELSDQRVRVLTDTTAMITYTANYTALINGTEQDFKVYATSVYVLEGGEWRSALHQQSTTS